MRILVGITGASGHPVAVEFLKSCPAEEKYLVASKWGEVLLKEETGLNLADLSLFVRKVFGDEDLFAPFCSGSTPFDAMVIVPCSISTLGKIASGLGDTLMCRAAQVALKERRRLLLAVRESPFSGVVLENCLKLSRAGADIIPLSPPFYTHPATAADVARDLAGIILRSLGFTAGKGWRPEELE